MIGPVHLFPELTRQQARAALLIAQDRTARQIATELGVTVATVHSYRYDVCRRLDVNGNAGVTAIAFQRGYVPLTKPAERPVSPTLDIAARESF